MSGIEKIIQKFRFSKKTSIFWALIIATLFFYYLMLNCDNYLFFFPSLMIVLFCALVLLLNRNDKMLAVEEKSVGFFLVFILIFSGITFCFINLIQVTFDFSLKLNLFENNPSIFSGFIKSRYFIYLFLFILVPIFEEFIFRRFLLKLLLSQKVPLSSLVVSILFVLFHKSNSTAIYVSVFLFSIQANYLFLKTNRVIFNIIFHVANNVGGVLIFGIMHSGITDNMKMLLDYSVMLFGLIFLLILNRYLFRLDKRKRRMRVIRSKKSTVL